MSPVLPLPVTETDHDNCAATGILRLVGQKWTVVLLALLAEQPYGFNELDRTIHGVSRRILTRTLRHLEQENLIGRVRTPQRAEYALTDAGRTLLPLIIALGEWAVDHHTRRP